MAVDTEPPPTSKRQRIQHLEQREWVLARPETYIGALEPTPTAILDFTEGVATAKTVTLSPALLSLTKELFDNAIDNCQRDGSQKYIKIECRDGVLVVRNDGSTLPVELDEKTGKWAITLAFGEFQSGSNFDEADGNKQTLYTVGRNGVGSKGCNVFSTKFEVCVMNAHDRKSFCQTWEANMSVVHPPKVGSCSRKCNETSVAWYPDFARLGGDGGREFLEDICRWYAHNTSLCSPPHVRVSFNGEAVKLRSPEHFCRALGGTGPLAVDTVEREGRTLLHVCVAARGDASAVLSSGSGLTYAFVNGTPCCDGSHAKYIISKVGDVIEAKARSKRGGNKDVRMTPLFVQSRAVIVAVVFVEKERFTDQRKSVLDAPVRDWGWKWDPSAAFVAALERSSLPDQLVVCNQEKSDADAAKATKTSSRNLNIAKYEPALRRHTSTATLIVCEGDSAGNLVRSGLTVVGRKDYGLYPLRGKFLNVRGLNKKTIMENKEALELLRILGIQLNVAYDAETVKKLPYAKLMVMTDQDVDGSHIMGLLFNLIDVCAPTLLQHKSDYLNRFATSLIRVTLNRKEFGFYSQVEYERWVEAQTANGHRVGTPKYFKGLGTSSAEQAKQYFRELAANTIVMVHDGNNSSESLDIAFNKKRADDRKAFLTERCDPNSFVDYSKERTSVQDFVYQELLPQYALASLRRAIPALDGFKEAHRKVFYGARSLKLTADISVANASGSIASFTNYHHRGSAMEDTIIGMAADYAGCPNMNLFLPHGQFGTRHKHSAASAAYPKICLNAPLHGLLFPPVDDVVLASVVDEGKAVEPVMYAPTIPLPLVFGCSGIATGWSTSVPTFHPLDVIDITRRLVRKESVADVVLHPWYRGFFGTIEQIDPTTFVVQGTGEWRGADFHVTEVPPFRETEAFKEDWVRGEVAPGGIHIGEGHTDERVHLILRGCKPLSNPMEQLGLRKRVSLGNMHLLNAEGSLKKYDSIVAIVEDYITYRWDAYEKRLRFLVQQCEREVCLANNKARFITACLDGSFDMRRFLDDDEVDAACRSMNLAECPPADGHGSPYGYLTTLPLRSLTETRAARLVAEGERKAKELEKLKNTDPAQLWLDDLDALQRHIESDVRYTRVPTQGGP